MSNIFGAIETGGTKIKVGIIELLNNDYDFPKVEIKEELDFPTNEPKTAIPTIGKFFLNDIKNINSIGISTFGPVDICPSSENYGTILKTPKLKWVNFNILKALENTLNFNKFAFTSDVNGAGYGESRIGAGKICKNIVYTTVGTGIGSGIIMNNKIFPTDFHTEIGHMYPKKHKDDLNFEGVCPYHKDCFEGLASGPTYEARCGSSGKDLDENDNIHNIIAYYLAQLSMNLTLSYMPEMLIFGGGVSKDKFLFQKIRDEFSKILNDYVTLQKPLKEYIAPAELGQNAGLFGSGLLAIDKFYFNR